MAPKSTISRRVCFLNVAHYMKLCVPNEVWALRSMVEIFQGDEEQCVSDDNNNCGGWENNIACAGDVAAVTGMYHGKARITSLSPDHVV